MGRSTIDVAPEMLESFIASAKQCGFEYLGKVAYSRSPRSYRVAIRGDTVPDQDQVSAIFTRRADNSLRVSFIPVR
jgi:DNA modification methylase